MASIPLARESTPPPAEPAAGPGAAYDDDFAAWAATQAALARAGRVEALDLAHIAEELEGLMNADRRALASHLKNLLLHLLKWQFQPERQGASWRLSISNARDEIGELLVDSPSFRRHLPALVFQQYPKAGRNAADETGLPKSHFPETCPYTVAQILDEDWWPTPSDHHS